MCTSSRKGTFRSKITALALADLHFQKYRWLHMNLNPSYGCFQAGDDFHGNQAGIVLLVGLATQVMIVPKITRVR